MESWLQEGKASSALERHAEQPRGARAFPLRWLQECICHSVKHTTHVEYKVYNMLIDSIPMTPCRGNPTMTFYIKLVAFSIIFYGLVYAVLDASSCCDSDTKSSTLQFQVWCLTLFQRRPVKAQWRGYRRHQDNTMIMQE